MAYPLDASLGECEAGKRGLSHIVPGLVTYTSRYQPLYTAGGGYVPALC